MAIAELPTELVITQFGPPLIDDKYLTFATAQHFALPRVRLVAEISPQEIFARDPSAYGTCDSGFWSISATDWEKVLGEIRLLGETPFTNAEFSERTERTPEHLQRFRMFEEERRFVAQNFDELKHTFSGRYIAVLGSSVLDSDIDFSALAERVYQRFGYRRVFMPFIGRTKRIYRIPSPRIVR